MEGSFHTTTLSKAANQLIGHVTRAVVKEESCGSSVSGSHLEVPGGESINWHIWYRGYTGTLPDIDLLLEFLNMTLTLWAGGFIPCLYDGGIDVIAALEATETILAAEDAPGNSVPLREGGFLCPEELAFFAYGSVTLLGTSNNIIVSLI